MEDGELPRPPRRVPAGAGTLTQLQTTTPRAPEPPPRQPWIFGRILAGFLVVLLSSSPAARPRAGTSARRACGSTPPRS